MNPTTVDDWTERLAEAWQSLDPGLVADLFAVDATYRASPFRHEFRGRQAILDHWRSELSGAESVEVTWGDRISDGVRTAIEYRTTLETQSGRVIDAGVLIVEFEGQLCSSLSEYWMVSRPTPLTTLRPRPSKLIWIG